MVIFYFKGAPFFEVKPFYKLDKTSHHFHMKVHNERISKWAHLSFYHKQFSIYFHLKFEKKKMIL